MNQVLLRSGAILAGLLAPVAAHAGGITVAPFSAEKSCVTYELEWGREYAAASGSSSAGGFAASNGYSGVAGYAASSRYSAVYAREWGTELRRECTQNFPMVRSTIASALASAGPIPTGGQALTLSGRVTDVGYQTQAVATQGSSVADQFMVISVEFQLRNAAGAIVYGGTLTKKLNILTSTETPDVSYAASQTGRTTFSQLQQQFAYAVARAVIFHLQPLRVVRNDGSAVSLNYGTPLVPLGSAVMVAGSGSLRGRRLTVTSSMDGKAIAESDAHVSLADVKEDAVVTFIESDDPAANSRVLERVELPEN